MRFATLLLAACIGTAAVAAPPERKEKDGVDPRARNPEVGKGSQLATQPLKPGAYFNEQARKGVREYYAKGKQCPPGLARKNNGCLPPGQAKKWQIGEPMPRDAAPAPVPQDVLALLPRLPPGHQYIAYGGDILLIAAGSRMVVDAITIQVTVR
ncbi:hypothetical protein WG902_14055 [Ramlibacter sp. PS3R-8]|uniref:hypothetical protein n=1 Tax=Ramlibacter sp. PS3R-8 TaxID=3133437 RepID=UPI0030957CF5